ncbi:RNA polymerase sigma factor [Pseudoalteromonas rhizosphaerae]|uniref:RNA polymerase sigma factor n=1 Tax=Pseudoalteromonas rhizosphaerae TaxID=2518973 RepID=A0ABW8L2R9_9GAMM|nr:sigma factor [Pseudoalteromonas rhizosphaerae]
MKKSNYYTNLLHYAFKVTLHKEEAEDLLQTALLAAIEAKRSDLSCVNNRRWIIGVLRNQSTFNARSAARRKTREASVAYLRNMQTQSEVSPHHFVDTLPPSLKTTALLALTGHTKKEISWLLRASDMALRQRIVQIKRRWRLYDGGDIFELKGLIGELPFGQIRKALLKAPCRDDDTVASHDPDGHLFMVTSQNPLSRQHKLKSIKKEENVHVKQK